MRKEYRALRKTWIAHECRFVEEGSSFFAEFPDGMKLGDNLEEVVAQDDDQPHADETAKKRGAR